jgi:XTP/dITP diphosphohydrolase
MTQVLFASQNKGKQQEVGQLFTVLPDLELVFPQDFPTFADFDPEETGQTFQENAEIKAQAWFDKLDTIVVAEDTGLEIDALDGKPGLHSKRFFSGSDEDRNKEILRLLKSKKDRSAQFKTVACLLEPGKKPQFFEGIIRGRIATEISDGNGFGYDPIFIPDGYEETFAQVGSAVKNELSSRAIAITKVLSALRT